MSTVAEVLIDYTTLWSCIVAVPVVVVTYVGVSVYNNYSKSLRHVEHQTDELCKAAVRRNGLELKYVKNQTDEICLLAVQQDARALKYVKNPTDQVLQVALVSAINKVL